MATYAGRYDEVLLRKAGNRLAPPVANTTVLVYESDGSTTATLYTDRTKATTAANPVSVDASGNLEFFADPGTYVLSIRESGSQVATNTVTVLNDPAESTGGGATNLTWTASTSTVASDTGTDAVLTAVDATNPGLMTVAQSNKLAGIETAATADQTAAEILTAVKTVDGAGSGLDADLLRGTTPSAFGLTVLDDADAATARTTLGAEATLNAAGVVAKFTGTPNGTKFLRDDGTLVTPSGGTGANSETAAAQYRPTFDRTGIPWSVVIGFGTYGMAAEWTIYWPFYAPFPFTVAGAHTVVSTAGTAGGIARIGLCQWSPTSGNYGGPSTLVSDMGTVAVDSTGSKTLTSAVAQQPAGWYATLIVPSVTATFAGPLVDQPLLSGTQTVWNGVSGRFRRYVSTDTTVKSSGLPATLPAIINNSDTARFIAGVTLDWNPA